MSDRRKFVFIGNCQAFNIGASEYMHPYSVENIKCSSMCVTPGQSLERAKEFMLRHFSEHEYKMFGFLGQIAIQPSRDDMKLDEADAIIVSMFPEDACYMHNDLNFTMMISAYDLFKKKPEFESIVRQEFERIDLCQDGASYFKRFKQFLLDIRASNGSAPLFIIKRTSLFPLLSPHPTSLLFCWDSMWHSADQYLEEIQSQCENVHIVSLDHILAGMLSDEEDIQGYFPRLSVSHYLNDERSVFDFYLNTEYLAQEIWDRAALLIIQKTEKPQKDVLSDETIPIVWFEKRKPRIPDIDDIEELIRSGRILSFEKALSILMMMFPEEHTDILLKNKACIAIDYRPLDTLKTFIYLFPTPEMVSVVEFLENKIRNCTYENPSFKPYYLDRIDGMKRYLGYADKCFEFMEPFGNIALWGASGKGRAVLSLFRQLGMSSRLVGFIDSNESLTGTSVEGLRVYHPDDMLQTTCDSIMITSIKENEIIDQFSKMDLNKKPSLISFPDDFKIFVSVHVEKNHRMNF